VVLLRELKDQGSLTLLLTLGTVERCLGDFALATAAFGESLTGFRRLGQDYRAAYSLCGLGIVARLEGNVGQAAALLQESLSFARDRYALSLCLEALAGLACREDRPLRGATLFGAAETMRERIAISLEPYEVSGHDEFVAAAESSLGGTIFRRAWLEGQAMTQDEAIAFASHQTGNPAAEGRPS
jgi:hypothetical protein